jgi:hypothetical protein
MPHTAQLPAKNSVAPPINAAATVDAETAGFGKTSGCAMMG